MRLANAPCSWGTLEFEGLGGDQVGYSQMLDELQAAGYVGTELGDWGYMPTDSVLLREQMQSRGLSLRGAFVPIALPDATAHEEGIKQAVRTAKLLKEAGDPDDPAILVLADANGTDSIRTKNAGRVTSSMALSSKEWDVVVMGATAIAQVVRQETGLKTAFHHHCAGYIETPNEIATFLDRTDPDEIGLVFDTGHYAYGAGDATAVIEGLEHFGSRIEHLHFKDCSGEVAARAGREGWDYFEAVRNGVFCELGLGEVDFEKVLRQLRQIKYEGWIVVEQDVLPGMGHPKESAARNRAFLRTLGL